MSESPLLGGQGEAVSRGDMALVRQAIRNGWKVSEEVRTKILKRLAAYVDDDPDSGPRVVIAAARTIVVADLTQQKLDLAREKFEGRKDELDLIDTVTQAEKRALEFERERAADRPDGPVP